MAFRVPAQAPPRRQTSYPVSQRPPDLDTSALSQNSPDDESTQWVLFSPSQDASVTDHTLSASERTHGPSRLSDFGSFDTRTRSGTGTGVDEPANDDNDDEDDDATEWDSLDDGLHAFPDPSSSSPQDAQTSSAPPSPSQGVLPAHDGLGGFFAASTRPAQEQLWQFERFNPNHRRSTPPELHLRSMSSIRRQLDTVAESEEVDVERERWERIERWRLDQSHAMLREVERETRFRRRNSRVSLTSNNNGASSSLTAGVQQSTTNQSSESFWQRITRKFIRNLIGINDDSLLFVILGETLPGEDPTSAEYDFNAMMEKELDSVPNNHDDDERRHWQARLLQRIARELGVILHQFVGHPGGQGAFTAFSQLSEGISNEYAGMPVVRSDAVSRRNRSLSDAPEATTTTSAASASNNNTTNNNVTSIQSPVFNPTLNERSEHASNWGIEEEEQQQLDGRLSETARLQQEREYWERDLDVKMIFRYLRDRFGGNTARDNSDDVDGGDARLYTHHNRVSSTSTGQSLDPSRRAAVIRHHHPLVAHAHSRSTTARPAPAQSNQRFRRKSSSSCASRQSAKLSVISSKRTLTGSSRNYWDIGCAAETGGAVIGIGGWDV